MSRTLAGAATTQLATTHVRPVQFVSLAFDSGTQRLHDGVGVITWGAQTWYGVGDFGGVDLIEEGEQASPFAIRLRLSLLDATMSAEALTGDYHLRAVVLYIGFLDSSNALVADPDVIWKGTLDVVDVQAGETNAMYATCESYLARLDRTNGKLFTDAEIRRTYSTDTFFKYVPQMIDLRLIWAESRAGFIGTFFNNGGAPAGITTRIGYP